MIRITALNDRRVAEHGGEKACIQISTTKEALESEAVALYNKGLSLRNQGHYKEAIQTLLDVLNSPFLQETSLSNRNDGISRSAELLKYSAYKNLAEMSEKEGNLMVAMEYYIEAVAVDSTDVTVWCKMGQLAMSLENFSLARHSFEMGLQCNSNHWPCLDSVICLLYALNNYEACLHYIAEALKLDPNYSKGIAFMRQIFAEHPGLRSWSQDLFAKCDYSIYCSELDEEEKADYVSEAVTIRLRKQELSRPPEMPSVSFTQNLSSFKWKNLGECLLSLYKHISRVINEPSDGSTGLQPRISLSSRVDLSANISPSDLQEVTSVPSSPPMTSLLSQAPEAVAVGTNFADSIPTTPTQDPAMSLSDIGMDVDQGQFSGSRKRGRKRRSILTDEPEYKRRSARVKNPTKGCVEEAVSCEKMLHKFLPKALLTSFDYCQSAISHRPSEGIDDRSKDPSDRSCSLRYIENEEDGVKLFLKENKENSGIIDLIIKFLLILAEKSDLVWPVGLTDIFLKLYHQIRKHLTYPNYFASDNSDDQIRKMAKMNLLHKELKLDRHLTNGINIIQSSIRKSPVANAVGSSFGGKHFDSDVDYLFGLSVFSDKLGEFWLEFCIRVFWLQARLALVQNNMDLATNFFEKTAEYVQMLTDVSSICLSNCSASKIISLQALEHQLDSLRKYQSMEELHRLADSGQHAKVIDFLLPTGTVAKDLDAERMKLLQESVIGAKEFKRGLIWAEDYFHETLYSLKKASSESQKDVCKDVLIRVLQILNQFLAHDPNVLSALPGAWIYRLSQDLIEAINFTLDVPEAATDMAFDLVTSWIILYRLIKHFETLDSLIDEDSLPSSLSLLIYAHEYLGRHSWCMTCDGELPLFIVEVFSDELAKYGTSDESHPFEEDLENALQQCFYCLYGHRTKKARYLDEHNVPQIPLTLERCQRIFDFFKPKLIPEYDSYKMNAISAELEVLLKRIVVLVPPISTVVETEVGAYIDGLANNLPSALAEQDIRYPLLKELYYLLADYYFKSKEQVKAMKFYMYDICVNPKRFDSWAGMALARSSRLENKLNSHDPKQESSLQKLAFSTLRCFKRAMELDDSNVKLWIEYGSCAYQLHSHASRLLKQAKFSPLTQEMSAQATVNKTEMLVLSLDCYNQAFACALESGNKEEEWLLHYMLAKIAEKLDQDPNIYLEHYKKAIDCLHEDKAKYPKKISYFSPPHLSVEALEMYYRTHVCIVKFLLKHEKDLDKIPFDVFESHVKDAADGPFVAFTEKKHDKKSEVSENKCPISCNDHNYSKPKIAVSAAVSNSASSAKTVPHQSVSVSTSSALSDAAVATHVLKSNSEVGASDGNVAEPVESKPLSCQASGFSVGENENLAVAENLRSKTDDLVTMAENSDNVAENKVTVAENSVATAENDCAKAENMSIVSENIDIAIKKEAVDLPVVGLPVVGYLDESKRDIKMEVSFCKMEVDAASDVVSGSNTGVSVSATNILLPANEPCHPPTTPPALIKQKSDSDALDDLISTLAAVQKTILTENEVEDEIALLSPEPLAVKESAGKVGEESNAGTSGVEASQTSSDFLPENSSSLPTEKSADKSQEISSEVESLSSRQNLVENNPENVEKKEENLAPDSGKELEKTDAEKSSEREPLLKRFLSLMNTCMKALNLCQTRFPEHVRSVYRLAYVHFYSANYKDVGRCKDLLLGGNSINFGIFHERKQNNFFNGLWRNPVQDLDRWGSFNAHLNRALQLLFDVLVVMKDSQMLFNMHQHLCRAPIDIGKKYLRDADRINLARMAFVLCCDVLEAQVRELESSKGSSKGFPLLLDDKFLLHICAVRQQSHKLNLNVDLVDGLLITAYRVFGLSLDFMQNQFLQVQCPPRLPQFQTGSFEKDARQHSAPITPTSLMSSLKWCQKPALLSAIVGSTPFSKRLPSPSIQPQRPPFQVDEAPKIAPTSTTSDIEVIDLSSDDCAPAKSSTVEDTESAKAVASDVGDLRNSEEKKGEKFLQSHSPAIAKDFQEVVQVVRPLPKPSGSGSKPSQTSKFFSKFAPFQKSPMMSIVSPHVSPSLFSDALLASAVAASKAGRLSGDALKVFGAANKPFISNKQPQGSGQNVPLPEQNPKLSLPILKSTMELLSTLPKATRDLLAAPRRKQETVVPGIVPPVGTGKLCSTVPPIRSPSVGRTAVPSSPLSELSSSSLSESEDDDLEVIELSSSDDSD